MSHPCQSEITPSAQRVVDRTRAAILAVQGSGEHNAALFQELLSGESLAAACLRKLGFVDHLSADERAAASEDVLDLSLTTAADDPAEFTQVLDRARFLARRRGSELGVTTEDLLLAAVECSRVVGATLLEQGITADAVRSALTDVEPAVPDIDGSHAELVLEFNDLPGPESDVEDPITPFTGPSATMDPAAIVTRRAALRIVDASLNRAREGLRVLDDFSRFVVNEAGLSADLKQLRHDVVTVCQRLSPDDQRALLTSRDTVGDVGTGITTAGESARQGMADIVSSNCHRVQEALRSAEEFGKLLATEFSSAVKQLRYQTYTLEQKLALRCAGPAEDNVVTTWCAGSTRLTDARVYLLLTESTCRLPWQQVVHQSLEAGVDVIQLREKFLTDRELLRRGRWLAAACREIGAISIVNDRADVAALVEADGLHVGQDELPVPQARQILGAHQLLGMSTHTAEQADEAMAAGVDYLGVGPVFPSLTKEFSEFAGLDFVRSCASRVRQPWFAIGGITPDNLDDVIRAGASRIAVSSVVLGSDRPSEVVRELSLRMNAAERSSPEPQMSISGRALRLEAIEETADGIAGRNAF